MAVVRYRYRPAPVQPVLVDGKENASLSLAKLDKPPEADPFADLLASAWEEPAFLPSQTQRQRTVDVVRSDEERYRVKHYPTINERIAEQKIWAQRQLQEAKIAAKKAAIRKVMDKKLIDTLSAAQGASLENMGQYEKELNDLLQESEESIQENGESNAEVNAHIARQLLDLKERKVLATKSAAQYHKHFTPWRRRRKALAYKLGLLRVREGPATVVLPWLLIGARELACDQAKLEALNVTHILNMTHDCPNMFPNSFVYEQIPVRDSLETDLSPHWPRIVSFIKRTELCKGRILVHCTAGASRAPSAVLAYLISEKGLPLVDAYTFLTSIREVVQPNDHFLFQLAMLEVKLTEFCSVYHHKDWRFYEFNNFRTKNVPGRKNLGAFFTVCQLYNTIPPVEGSPELRNLFSS